MNNITLLGRLTKDPELRKTPTDKSVTTFSLAVEREYSKSETDYFDCVAWGQEANFVSQFFHKGDMLALKGRGQFRDYTDRQGQTKRVFEVVAERVYFAGNKREKPVEFAPVEDDGSLPF